MLVPAVYQHESAIGIHMSLPLESSMLCISVHIVWFSDKPSLMVGDMISPFFAVRMIK